jgi:hypothetical protein
MIRSINISLSDFLEELGGIIISIISLIGIPIVWAVAIGIFWR